MQGFNAVLLNELEKLLTRKKIVSAAILSIVAVIIGQAAVLAVKKEVGLAIAGSGEFPIVVLSVFVYTLLPLFSALVAIDMFSGEFSANTMKIIIVRPVTRFSIYSAKILGVAIFILSNLLFTMIISTIASVIFNGGISFVSIIKILIAYIVTLLPVFVFTLFVILISNVFKNGITAFFISVLVFITFYVLGLVFSGFSRFLITSMFDWYSLWIADTLNFLKIIRLFLIMSGCGIMVYTTGFFLFDKKAF